MAGRRGRHRHGHRGSRSGGEREDAGAAGHGWVFGIHAVEAVLARRAQDIRSALVSHPEPGSRLLTLVRRLEGMGLATEVCERRRLDELAGDAAHQGIALEVVPQRMWSVTELEALVFERGRSLRLLVLDQVTDPRNLGACLRTADAAAIDAVVVPRDRSAKLTPAALKTAAGAAETVPVVQVTNLARTLAMLRDAGVTVAGAAGEGEQNLFDADLAPPLAVVLGSEGGGLRRLTREHCDLLFSIPMFGTVASLNVSVAAAVVLYEWVRQYPPRGDSAP